MHGQIASVLVFSRKAKEAMIARNYFIWMLLFSGSLRVNGAWPWTRHHVKLEEDCIETPQEYWTAFDNSIVPKCVSTRLASTIQGSNW